MFYSCFDPKRAVYDYFEDEGGAIAINGDLPVPRLPSATQLGVAAIEIGRPLPPTARPAGEGWHARGQIVQCGRGPLGAIPSASAAWDWVASGGWKWIAGGLAIAYVARRI